MKPLLKRFLMLLQVVLKRDRSPKVFFYHDVGREHTPMGTPSRLFWKHMSLLAGTGSQVCFDDGFRGIWDERETFRAKGIRPTVFIAVWLVGRPGYLTWDEIRTLRRDYGFEFQCHTWSHQTLAGGMIDESPREERTEAWFAREIVESKAELCRQLGELAPAEAALCFPVGQFDDDVVRRCREAGYARVYASYPGNVSGDYVQPRNIAQDLSPFGFKLALQGGLMAFYHRYHKLHYISANGG